MRLIRWAQQSFIVHTAPYGHTFAIRDCVGLSTVSFAVLLGLGGGGFPWDLRNCHVAGHSISWTISGVTWKRLRSRCLSGEADESGCELCLSLAQTLREIWVCVVDFMLYASFASIGRLYAWHHATWKHCSTVKSHASMQADRSLVTTRQIDVTCSAFWRISLALSLCSCKNLYLTKPFVDWLRYMNVWDKTAVSITTEA